MASHRASHRATRRSSDDSNLFDKSSAEFAELKDKLAQMNYRNKNAILALLFPVAIAAKVVAIFLLPDKYFFDNTRILNMVNGTAGDSAWIGSYQVASDLFTSLNFFDFTTMVQWSIFLGMLFNILLFFVLLKADSPDLLQSLFILATVGLMNIYIFNIGKDIIQFAFFLGVYIVLVLPIKNSLVKVLGSAAILYFESTFFREYYILIAGLVLVVYAILLYFRERNKLGLGSLSWIITLLLASIYAVMLISRVIMPEEYTTIIQLRAGYVDSFGTGDNGGIMATAIRNWIPGESLPIFMVNYVINLFRMLIPIELAFRGAAYLPFFVFQCAVTAYMVNLIRQINKVRDPAKFIALCVFIGYVLASAIFEPDFGSWTRHESATFPILHLLILNPLQKVPMTAEERTLKAVALA
ncbi:hypothetical protein JS532_06900 [Bifidobacterium callimiconis]|uniref:hypothetical protein n=1 Tax=Bifidobacterium callimiconis TaxID=2306973 RepID=UPI001BDCD2B3|nr:hypothetical protein [Bifidobacterium callimiconis]MBT1177293.1 hypothetical protein [Bifidobacterium callimiconis]